MTDFLISLFSISAVMAAVILLLCLISKPLKKVSASSRYLLWALIAVRLCIPVSMGVIPKLITIPVDAYKENTAETVVFEEETRPVDTVSPTLDSSVSNVGGAEEPDIIVVKPQPVPDVTPDVGGQTIDTPAAPKYETNTSDVTENNVLSRNEGFDLSLITYFIFAAWCAGALISFSVEMAKYFKYRRYITDSLYSADEDMLSMYRELCAEMEIGNYPPLFLSKKAESPMLMGYFSPCIVYPESMTAEKSMSELIAHELTHHRRCDLWVKLMAVTARSLHWFNPAVYIAASRLEAEMELSCDEKTLRGKGGEDRLAYGQSMLEVVKSCSEKSAPLTTNFNPQKEAVKERLMNIFDTTKKRKGIALISVILALCIVSGSIIGCNVSSQSIAKDGETKNEEPAKSAEKEPKKFEDGEWQKIYGRYLMENQWAFTSAQNYYTGEGLFYLDDINGDGKPDFVQSNPGGNDSTIHTEKNKEVGAINFLFGGTNHWLFDASALRYKDDGSMICFHYDDSWYVFVKNDTEEWGDYLHTYDLYEHDGKYYYMEVDREKLFDNPDGRPYRGEDPVELTKEEYNGKLEEFGLSDDNFISFKVEDMYAIVPENIEAKLGYKASDKKNAPEGAAFTETEIDELGKKYGDTALSDEVKKFLRGEHDISRNFTFGDWYVTMKEKYEYPFPTAYVTVDITESSLDTVKSGVHIFEMETGVLSITVRDTAIRPDDRCVNYKHSDFISTFYNAMCHYNLVRAEDVSAEDMKYYSIAIYDFLGNYLGAGKTKQEYNEYAENIFGLKDHSGYDVVFDPNGYGHGGGNVCYEFIASDENSVTVQLYSDVGCMIKSDVIKYTFEEYGDYLALVSVEMLHESENEPLAWMT